MDAEDAVASFRKSALVCGDDHSDADILGETTQNLKDNIPRCLVKRTGWFICQQD
jgi:hypothetical protein